MSASFLHFKIDQIWPAARDAGFLVGTSREVNP